jgi:5-methylcytosine-specific restriction endonuclease McrA
MNRSCATCGRIIPATQTRCDLHEAAFKAQRQAQKNQYSSPAWRALRQQVLQRRYCEDCGHDGAKEVHHRFSVKDGNPLICPLEHLLLLCRPCHLNRESRGMVPGDALAQGYRHSGAPATAQVLHGDAKVRRPKTFFVA